MTAGQIAELVTAVTALVAAVGTVLSQISHLNWHKQASAQPSEPYTPPAVTPPKP